MPADLIIAETENDYPIDFQEGDLITKPVIAVSKECEHGNMVVGSKYFSFFFVFFSWFPEGTPITLAFESEAIAWEV